MSALLESLLTPAQRAEAARNDAKPWNLLRDAELSREAPAAPSTANEDARQAFLGAIQKGDDVPMPSESGADLYLSRHLGELCEESQRNLLAAIYHAMCGRPCIAGELLRDIAQAEATVYADHNEERFM
jgi:hypothetical protein